MFGIGSTELLVILLVALLVLGPKSLAGFSSKLGKLVGEFRRVSTDFQRALNLEAARAEAREAESRNNGNSQEGGAQSKGEDTGSVPVPNQYTDEELRLHGIAEDSPLAQALKRARDQAHKAEKNAAKAEEAAENAQELAINLAEASEKTQREKNDS